MCNNFLLIRNSFFFLFLLHRSKFSFKVHCYMLELYNDRLIDLLAPHGKEVSFDSENVLSLFIGIKKSTLSIIALW